jgi:hypothetical protein
MAGTSLSEHKHKQTKNEDRSESTQKKGWKLKRDRVMQTMRQIMAYVRAYAMEGENEVHIDRLKKIYELDMGWSSERTQNKWTEMLVRHKFLARKSFSKDRVFFITDKDRGTPLEQFGGPQVKLETE